MNTAAAEPVTNLYVVIASLITATPAILAAITSLLNRKNIGKVKHEARATADLAQHAAIGAGRAASLAQTAATAATRSAESIESIKKTVEAANGNLHTTPPATPPDGRDVQR